MNLASKEVLLLWRQSDRMWRWSWSLRDEDGGEQKSLISSEAFQGRAEALSSARQAYPGLEVLEVDAEKNGSRRGRGRGVFAAAAVAAAGLLLAFNRRNHRETGCTGRKGRSVR